MIRSIRFDLFICLVLSLYSLNTFAQKAEVELIAGPAMVSSRWSEGDINRKIKIAPLAGIGFNYHMTNHWSAGVQLLYELKGVKSEGELPPDFFFANPSNSPIKYEVNTNLNYLSLPVMVRYSFGQKIQWSAGAGGYISHLMKAEQHATIFTAPVIKQSFHVTKSYNKIDAGICMSVGVAIPLTEKLRLKGSLSESIGFVDVNESIDPSTGEDFEEDVMTNSLSLQVGISYLLGGK